MKKGQITLIVIVGLLLLLVVALLLFLKPTQEVPQTQENFESTEQLIQLCIQSSAENALLIMGEKGRIQPNMLLTTKEREVNYFFFRELNFLPPKRDLEHEISDYITQNLAECVSNKVPDVTITENGPLFAETTFNENDVRIDVHYPLTLTKGTSTKETNDFIVLLPVPMSQYYTTIEELIIQKYENSKELDVAYLFASPYEFSFITHNNETLIVQMTDPETSLSGSVFTWNFAIGSRSAP